MYSQQGGRPGTAAGKIQNRYMKGRLPDGVDFAAYPGRSSTPLPTAESKSAERINQLKIWNEAATNDDKRRLNTQAKKGVTLTGTTSTTRRTDSYKDAKDRHSASFHGAPPPPVDPTPPPQRMPIRSQASTLPSKSDMFADRSDSESSEEHDHLTPPPDHHHHHHHQSDLPHDDPAPPPHHQLHDASAVHSDPRHGTTPSPPEQTHSPVAYVPTKPQLPEQDPVLPHHPQADTHTRAAMPADSSPMAPPPKEAKGCCTIM